MEMIVHNAAAGCIGHKRGRQSLLQSPNNEEPHTDNIQQIVIEFSLEYPELTLGIVSPFIVRESDICFQSQAFIVFCMKEVCWNV